MKTWQKSLITRKVLISKHPNIFASKFDTIIWKRTTKFWCNFKVISLNWLRNTLQRESWPGRAGSSWFITDFDYMVRKKLFCSPNYIEKTNCLQNIALIVIPYDNLRKFTNQISVDRIKPNDDYDYIKLALHTEAVQTLIHIVPSNRVFDIKLP